MAADAEQPGDSVPRREYFDEDMRELREVGYVVPYFDCASWKTEDDLHDALRVGLGMPDYTGHNFGALADSLADIKVPEASGMMVALDNLGHALGAMFCLTYSPMPRGGGCCSDGSSA